MKPRTAWMTAFLSFAEADAKNTNIKQHSSNSVMLLSILHTGCWIVFLANRSALRRWTAPRTASR